MGWGTHPRAQVGLEELVWKVLGGSFHNMILTTSAVSWSNFGSILIFASCVIHRSAGNATIVVCTSSYENINDYNLSVYLLVSWVEDSYVVWLVGWLVG